MPHMEVNTGSMGGAVAAAPKMGGGVSSGFEMGKAGGGFSSRGLSNTFKDIPHSPTPSQNPIVNMQHGMESKSSFARSNSLDSKKSMFDVSNPVKNNPIVPHEISSVGKPSESKNNSMIDINNGKHDKPFFKRPEEFGKVKSMLDVSRPIHTETHDVLKPHLPEAKHMPVSTEKKPVETQREQVSPFKNTVVLWEAKATPSLKPETITQPSTQHLPHLQPKVHTEQKPDVKPQTAPKPITEVRTKHVTEERPLKELVKLKTLTSPATQTEVRTDIECAQSLVPKIVETQKITTEEASEMVARILAKKHVGKVEVRVKEKTATKPEVAPQPKTEAKVKKKLQSLGLKLQLKRKEEKEERHALPEHKRKVLYFEKDDVANDFRVLSVVAATEKVLFRQNPEQYPTGRQVVKEIERSFALNNGISEVAKAYTKDGSYAEFLEEVAKVTHVTKASKMKEIAEKITDRYTAVRLSFTKKHNKEADKKDAELVYGQALENVEAFVAEDGTDGKLYEHANGIDTIYVPRQKAGYEIKKEAAAENF